MISHMLILVLIRENQVEKSEILQSEDMDILWNKLKGSERNFRESELERENHISCRVLLRMGARERNSQRFSIGEKQTQDDQVEKSEIIAIRRHGIWNK